jgi:hypothetical protein
MAAQKKWTIFSDIMVYDYALYYTGIYESLNTVNTLIIDWTQ